MLTGFSYAKNRWLDPIQEKKLWPGGGTVSALLEDEQPVEPWARIHVRILHACDLAHERIIISFRMPPFPAHLLHCISRRMIARFCYLGYSQLGYSN